jgi:hypothetical protein
VNAGLDKSRTQPDRVIGHVAHPEVAAPENH